MCKTTLLRSVFKQIAEILYCESIHRSQRKKHRVPCFGARARRGTLAIYAWMRLTRAPQRMCHGQQATSVAADGS